MKPTLILCSMALCSLPLVGCGSGEDAPATAPVSGKVLYNGKPVPGAEVTFLPSGTEGGRPSTAQTTDDGTFVLHYSSDVTGVKVGPANVKVVIYGKPGTKPAAAPAAPGGAMAPPASPPKTFDFGTREVTETGSEFTLELTETKS